MAERYVYIPLSNKRIGVQVRPIEFDWYPGFAKSQKQKSIASLHQAAALKGISPVLEISSNAVEELGAALSAFNLKFFTKKHRQELTVEAAFQGSKVFERGGPYRELYLSKPREAKKFIQNANAGTLQGFRFFNIEFPLVPKTFFYDWLYVNALRQNYELLEAAAMFNGFTDIAFNPKKSINCQARSLALGVSMLRACRFSDELSDPIYFHKLTIEQYSEKMNTDLFRKFTA